MTETTQQAKTEAEPTEMFDAANQLDGQQQGHPTVNTPQVNTAQAGTAQEGTDAVPAQQDTTELLITNPDDDSKLDTITGAQLELTEEEIIARMTAGDEIRDTETVPTGNYIIALLPVDFTKHVTFIYKADAEGNPVPVREKSIGFRVKILYNVQTKEHLNDNLYQQFYLADKTGAEFKSGGTNYKRFCANAISAVLNDPKKDMDHVIKFLNEKKIPPAQAFNKMAASTDDNMRYMMAKIVEVKGKDGYPDSNEVAIGTIKDDSGYYSAIVQPAA